MFDFLESKFLAKRYVCTLLGILEKCLIIHILNLQLKDDNLILIVPGIANHSKSIYIQATARILVENGFDVAVFNHLGAHPNVKLTSPRIFTYGKVL